MQIETLEIVCPPTTGGQELAFRLSKGFTDASHSVAVYSSPEVCALAPEDLSNTTLLVASPGQCIEASGDEPVFLSKVACARKRILVSVGPVHSPGYLGSVAQTRNQPRGLLPLACPPEEHGPARAEAWSPAALGDPVKGQILFM